MTFRLHDFGLINGFIYLRWLSEDHSWSTVFMMKGALLVLALYFSYCHGAVVVRSDTDVVVNNRPIIGVLSQEQSYYLAGKYPKENYTSYIAASYVKAVESSGARVVPIM